MRILLESIEESHFITCYSTRTKEYALIVCWVMVYWCLVNVYHHTLQNLTSITATLVLFFVFSCFHNKLPIKLCQGPEKNFNYTIFTFFLYNIDLLLYFVFLTRTSCMLQRSHNKVTTLSFCPARELGEFNVSSNRNVSS